MFRRNRVHFRDHRQWLAAMRAHAGPPIRNTAISVAGRFPSVRSALVFR
jgi:hypothetical protein